jgi:hypothetical protein
MEEARRRAAISEVDGEDMCTPAELYLEPSFLEESKSTE